ncbi:hypothetical protein AB834_00610 [PVC group bacterium (ex Bugula neritina AB1)]|nr:hypothetical protein AB834_00610 [PVC group bacterium (ex Bugula neritina AB1)]
MKIKIDKNEHFFNLLCISIFVFFFSFFLTKSVDLLANTNFDCHSNDVLSHVESCQNLENPLLDENGDLLGCQPTETPKMDWFRKIFQFDILGQLTHTKFNYTDLTPRYSREDSWIEFKTTFWLDKERTFAPYVSIIPSRTSHTSGLFWWQNYNEVNTGIQWYPLYKLTESPCKYIRFFAYYSNREYYSKPPSDTMPKGDDFRVGFDYYFDNIFGYKSTAMVFRNKVFWAKTNFVTLPKNQPSDDKPEDFNSFIWEGDFKYGPIKRMKNSIVYPYFTTYWVYSPDHARVYDNYIRVGGGLQFYPWGNSKISDSVHPLKKNFAKHFYLYSEAIYNAKWLGDEPSDAVNDTDIRFGIGMSTSGFFRQRSDQN